MALSVSSKESIYQHMIFNFSVTYRLNDQQQMEEGLSPFPVRTSARTERVQRRELRSPSQQPPLPQSVLQLQATPMIVSVIIIVREKVTVSVNGIVSIRVSVSVNVSVSASVSVSIVTIGMSAPSSQGVAVPTSGEGEGVSAPPSATATGEF